MPTISCCSVNSSRAMPSKHFFKCGCTRIGSLVSDRISSSSSLDRKKNLEVIYMRGYIENTQFKLHLLHDTFTSSSLPSINNCINYSPGEVEPLLFQVGIETFLDLIEQDISFLQSPQHVGLVCCCQAVCVFHCLCHDVLPIRVHDPKLAAFLWHLSHDVLRAEDWLQVKPGGLAL